jgi:hypothetical protein
VRAKDAHGAILWRSGRDIPRRVDALLVHEDVDRMTSLCETRNDIG